MPIGLRKHAIGVVGDGIKRTPIVPVRDSWSR